jgi:hypothetical protein
MNQTLQPNTYYRSHFQGYGLCSIKALANQMLCVSEKPLSIFTMAGLISEHGTTQISKSDFDTLFEKVKFQLQVLKNT